MLFACSQKVQNEFVPKPILQSFESKFPDATEVVWDLDVNADWQASFKKFDRSYVAKFKADGEWIETDHRILKSGVPFYVKMTLHDTFSNYQIENVVMEEKKSGAFYEMEVLTHDHLYDIEADERGKIIKEKIIN